MMAVYGETIRMLKQVFQTRYDVFLVTGSGSAGMEAAIASTIEAGDKVVGDGYFSDLIKFHGGEYFSVPMPRGEADSVRKWGSNWRNTSLKLAIIPYEWFYE